MNQRDIETLSTYLDGQLNASDLARLENRLKTDPELVSVLSDLRAARGILRKLPARKAPRNFTLTRRMVGLKPPLPRTYPLFRLATIFASILFMFSFTVTALKPMFSFGASEPATMFGMGGGGDAAMEEPAAPAVQEMAPADSTAEDSTRIVEPTPAMKEGETAPAENIAPEAATQPEAQNEPPVSYIWSIISLVISLASGLVMWVMYKSAQSKWR